MNLKRLGLATMLGIGIIGGCANNPKSTTNLSLNELIKNDTISCRDNKHNIVPCSKENHGYYWKEYDAKLISEDYNGAFKIAKEFKKEFPKKSSGDIMEAYIHFKNGNYEKSVESYKKALEKDYDDEDLKIHFQEQINKMLRKQF